MKNIKKLMSIILVLTLVAAMAACSSDEDAGSGSMDLTESTSTEESSSEEAAETEAADNTETTTEETVEPMEEAGVVETAVRDAFTNLPDHIYKIGQTDFLDKVVAGDDMVIIDIRSEASYNEGHVQGAISLPWGGTAISDGLKFIPQDKEVFIYCVSGQTAGQTVLAMNAAGINARSVNLGYKFGIAKTEGYDEVINETTVNAIGSDTYDIDPEVQAAMDAYYAGLADVKDTDFVNYKVSEDKLKSMIENNEDFFLLSSRKADDFAKAHIEGAVNIPYGSSMLDNIGNVPMDKKVVVYCYSGQTAGQATAAMRLLGYDAVSLNGGMGVGSNAPIGWTNKDYPIVSQTAVEAGSLAYFANMPDNIYKIGQTDFLDKVVAGDDMVIIDIRSEAAYNEAHVNGAISLPWGGTAISDGLKSIPQDKEVFIYCVSGQTAGQTVMIMNLAGINARSVNLGYKFGIATTEGYEDVITETAVNTFGSETYDIDPEVQAAADVYYAGLAEVKDTTYTNYKISEDNLKAMIEADEDFYLLSIRGADDYAAGHIAGANNVPWGTGVLEGILASVPMDKKVVVYCYSGQTAGQATAAMRLMGYDAVSLNGGMGVGSNAPIGWSNKGYDVVTTTAVEDGVMEYFAQMPDHIYKIGQQDFVDKVRADEDMVIIDIRSAAAYEESHVKGAISMPWGGTAISDGLKTIPQDKEVYIYCVSGQTAGQTVMAMNLAGISARSVNLGFKFGISKVDGVDDVLTTEVTPVSSAAYPIDLSIQSALDSYYAGLADVKDTTYTNYKISEDNLEAMITADEDFFLLSIRGADAFAEGHIEGAVNVPWGSDMMTGILETVPMDKKVVVYCYSGQTAGQATAAMKLLGYDAVSLNGGMGVGSNAPIGWSNAGKEVVTD